jgi:signal transduction histidine kinase
LSYPSAATAATRTLPVRSRVILLGGFGGLLLLMAFAELDGIREAAAIQAANDGIREDFLLRTGLLERIRSDLYVSGTYSRDYLLEPEADSADAHRASLLATRADMDAALRRYRGLLTAREARPFADLERALGEYWRVLQPAFPWTGEARRRHGYLFLRDEVFPRRTAMLAIADQIEAIDQSQLDEGRNRVQATFRRFRRRLMAEVGLTIGLGLVLAVFTTRRILALETETAARYREIALARGELKDLSARLLEAQEQERRLISRELHDEVGQALTGTLVEMANLSRLARAGDLESVQAKADEIKRGVEQSISAVRNMALLLRPSMLDDLGLIPALQWQAREVGRRTGLRVRVAADGIPEELPEELKTCIYRVVQEALHNAARHAGAGSVRVTVAKEDGTMLLSVQDDGCGFDTEREKGLGILGMKERVGRLRGRFSIDSAPGRGTVVRVSLPIPAAEMEAAITHT